MISLFQTPPLVTCEQPLTCEGGKCQLSIVNHHNHLLQQEDHVSDNADSNGNSYHILGKVCKAGLGGEQTDFSTCESSYRC